MGGGGRWAAGDGLYFPLGHTESSAVSSVSDRNRLNLQDESRQLLAAVWHHSHPY